MTRSIACALFGAAMALSGCGRPTEPADVADRFVALYYVQMSQGEALELTTGRATRILEHELSAVQAIRDRGYGPGQARPAAYFRRVRMTIAAESATASYVLRTEVASTRVRRRIDLDLRRQPDGWRISDFHQIEL